MKAARARTIETEGHGQAVPPWPTMQAPTLSRRPVQRPKLHYFVQVLSQIPLRKVMKVENSLS
jgi:hypothetical protein